MQSLVFGKEPLQQILRVSQSIDIVESFQDDLAPQQVYMITGVRGSGKTVFMTEISRQLSEDSDWIVVELNAAG